MKNPDLLWKDICYRYAHQSKCKSRKVGCVLVYEGRCIGQGWNGAPEGSDVEACTRERCKDPKIPSGSDLQDAICGHAEINCIGYCARHGVPCRGSTLYTTTFPCIYCASAIVSAGIVSVVYDLEYTDPKNKDMYSPSLKILKNAGILVRRFETS